MGGAEVFTREVACRFVKFGHNVTLFTSTFAKSKDSEVSHGVKIIRNGGKYSVYWNAKKYYKKHFSKENYDVVIDEINTRPFFAPKFVNNGEKVVALIHQLAREYWFYETPFPTNYLGYHLLEDRWLQNYADVHTVTVSKSTKQDLLELGFKKVYVVPEGLNFKPLAKVPEKGKPVVIFAGRLKRAKRPDHALKAFKIVKGKFPEAELWVIGDGPFKSDLERIGDDGVKFFGYLDNVERRRLMKQAWVLVNPSVREGWGLNIIEANALGVPCIAYDVPGLRDSIKNQETGLLAKAGDIIDLASQTTIVLTNKQLRERLSRNALDHATKFSWDKTAENFIDVVKN
jgi:glycosyltransferase involved in cell wall biosynthesis